MPITLLQLQSILGHGHEIIRLRVHEVQKEETLYGPSVWDREDMRIFHINYTFYIARMCSACL